VSALRGGLTPPVTDRDHADGPAHAPIILVEYGDYECPFCARAYPIVKALRAALESQLRLVFRNFPLTQTHPHAQHAAEAAEAAAVQGRFWEMHDLLFEHQDALDDRDLIGYAGSLGLDLERFVSELESGTYRRRVREDFRSGVRSGVNGTPTFFVNGERYDGSWRDPETFLRGISQQVRATA
jgi:protein-disulfide isomerase